MKELTKEERIKKEIRRLNSILKNLDKKTISGVKSLVENAAFMSVTLDDLQADINKNGVVSEYQNGANQWGTKKSPEVEIYNAMIKNHMNVMKQITELFSKDGNKDKDELLEFLSGGSK